MHSETSTPTEVAASKIEAARRILAGALLEVAAGQLSEAEAMVDKAGSKLHGAKTAIAAARHGGGS